MTVLCDTRIRELIGIEPLAVNAERPRNISFGASSYADRNGKYQEQSAYHLVLRD